MKQNQASQTDWARVQRNIDEDAPIPSDDEDRAEGLYDPNNEAEVEEFFRNATVIYPDGSTRKLPAKEEVSLHLSQDVLAYYLPIEGRGLAGGDRRGIAAVDEVLTKL